MLIRKKGEKSDFVHFKIRDEQILVVPKAVSADEGSLMSRRNLFMLSMQSKESTRRKNVNTLGGSANRDFTFSLRQLSVYLIFVNKKHRLLIKLNAENVSASLNIARIDRKLVAVFT